MKKSRDGLIITLWILLCMIVIIGFFAFSFAIGGSAINGYYENGHYFVGNHSEIAEVSQTIWLISYIWENSYFIFIPLTPIGAFLIGYIQEKIEKRKNRSE